MMDNLILAFLVLNVWDILSTLYVLKHGGRERNTVLLRWFEFDDPDAVLVRVKVVLLSAVWLAVYFGALPLWAMWALVIGYSGVALYNLRSVVRIAKKGNV